MRGLFSRGLGLCGREQGPFSRGWGMCGRELGLFNRSGDYVVGSGER